MKLGRHIYRKETIVIGNSVSPLLYAYKNNLPVISASPKAPFRFDKINDEYDLSFLGLEPFKEYHQRQIYQRLHMLLGLAGNSPLSSNAAGLRITDNLLTATTKNHRVIRFEFDKLVIFDDEGVAGLPHMTREERGGNRVIDWINVRRGCTHEFDEIHGDDDFVKHIIFYSSERADNTRLKDAVAISHLTDEQVGDFDFADTMVKFKVQKMMKAAGIRGPRNGRDTKYPDKYKYYAIRVEPAERVIERDIKRYYEPDERFEFRYDTITDLLAEPQKPEGYLGVISGVL
jgi:hypothetical protein